MRNPTTSPLVLALVFAASLALAACDAAPGATATPGAVATPKPTAQALWAAPPNAMELTVAAGLAPEKSESLAFHVHAHLDIFVDGQPILVPAGIGIDTASPDVQSFTESDGSMSWGGLPEAGCAQACISPLHTHASFGIIHTESASPTPNTLGQFFAEWAVTLSDSCVGTYCSPTPIAIYVNGEAYTGDPAEIELADRTQISIVIGTPPAEIPSTADFSQI